MLIALAQINPTIGALQLNTMKIKEYALKAGEKGARLVIYPELAITGYPPKDLLLNNSFINEIERLIFEELAPVTAGGPDLLLGAPYREEGELYNCALLISEGIIKNVHKKTLLPDYDVFDERRYFKASAEQKLELIGTIPCAITVCEDIWNDGDFFQRQTYKIDPVEILASKGARIIINLSASPYHLRKQEQREKMVGFLAAKYQAGLIYVNQVGGNDELIFDGNSLIFNDTGELIYRGASFAEELIFLETEALQSPFRGQVLAPPQEDIGSVFQALRLGIKDYLGKTGFHKAVIGLSGGIDSAVTAALAVEALGSENVLGVLMPSRYSSNHSVEDALSLAANLNIEQRTIPIDGPFQSFLDSLVPGGAARLDLAEENLQARLRGNIIMYLANSEGYLALTTGNKSELAVGYCTLYGDMAGGLAPLADLPKVMVYELAEHINSRTEGEIVPRRTILKPPSAELRPDQKDEDSLPPYPELDPILYHYIEENLSPEEIIQKGFAPGTVYRVAHLVDRSEYKRRQAAPGLRITSRAFGSGRRMPIARGYD